MKEAYTNIPLVRLQMLKEKNVRYGGGSLDHPERAAEILRPLIGNADRECLVICCVDAKMKPTYIEIVAMGTVDSCLASPREIFKTAVLSNAAGILLAHNHPSGSAEPSPKDREMTERLQKAGELLGIQLIDHIIVGDGKEVYSFREKECL